MHCTLCSAVHIVQCSAVQCSAVQCSAVHIVQCSAVQCMCGGRHQPPVWSAGCVHCRLLHRTVQCSAVQCSAVQCSAVWLRAAGRDGIVCTLRSLVHPLSHTRTPHSALHCITPPHCPRARGPSPGHLLAAVTPPPGPCGDPARAGHTGRVMNTPVCIDSPIRGSGLNYFSKNI